MAGSGGIRKDLKVPQVVGKFGRVLWFWRAPEQASEGPVRTANICNYGSGHTNRMPPYCWGCDLSSVGDAT